MGAAPPSAPAQAQAAVPLPANCPTLLAVQLPPGHKVPTSTSRCRCGNDFLPDATFCRKCGENRPAIWQGFCYCGNAFGADEVFCRKCGARKEAMELLVKIKMAAQERLRWSRQDDPLSSEAWNVNAKLESEFAYMHSLLCNKRFVEMVFGEFDDFDSDGNEALDQEEVAKAVPKMVLKHGWKTQEEVDKIDHAWLTQDFFRQMDRDSNARVSKEEFLVYASYFHYLCYQKKVDVPEIFYYQGRTPKPVVEAPQEEPACKCCMFC